MKKAEMNLVAQVQDDELNTEDSEITLYTAKDIQNIFHCGRTKAYQIMNMSGFPSFRIDSSIYVEKNELKKWIARMKNRNIST